MDVVDERRKFYDYLNHTSHNIRFIKSKNIIRNEHVRDFEEFNNICIKYDTLGGVYCGIQNRPYGGTKSEDVDYIDIFALDCDSIHPKDQCATDEELSRTKKRIEIISKELTEEFGEHSLITSGNGYYIYYKIPKVFLFDDKKDAFYDESGNYHVNRDEFQQKIHQMTREICDRYNDSDIDIDHTGDFARILRIPGTLNTKGKHSDERPYRYCQSIRYSDHVSSKLLEKIASRTPNLHQIGRSISSKHRVRRGSIDEKVDRSREEFKKILEIMEETASKSDTTIVNFKDKVFKKMQLYAKWSERDDAYRELTFAKTFAIFTENLYISMNNIFWDSNPRLYKTVKKFVKSVTMGSEKSDTTISYDEKLAKISEKFDENFKIFDQEIGFSELCNQLCNHLKMQKCVVTSLYKEAIFCHKKYEIHDDFLSLGEYKNKVLLYKIVWSFINKETQKLRKKYTHHYINVFLVTLVTLVTSGGKTYTNIVKRNESNIGIENIYNDTYIEEYNISSFVTVLKCMIFYQKSCNQCNQYPCNQCNHISFLQNLDRKIFYIFLSIFKITQKKLLNLMTQLNIDIVRETITLTFERNRNGKISGLVPDGYVKYTVLDGNKVYRATNDGVVSVANQLIENINSMLKIDFENVIKNQETEREEKFENSLFSVVKQYISEHGMEVDDDSENIDVEFKYSDIEKISPEMKRYLEDDVDKAITYMKKEFSNQGMDEFLVDKINIRIVDIPDRYHKDIHKIRSKHINKFIKTSGQIRYVEHHKIFSVVKYFRCKDCGEILRFEQELNGYLKKPTKCACGHKSFDEIENITRDMQNIRLIEEADKLNGRTTQSEVTCLAVDKLVTEDFQKLFKPGAIINIEGVLRSMYLKKNGRDTTEMIKYIEISRINTTYQDLNFEVTEEESAQIIKDIEDEGFMRYLIDFFLYNFEGNILSKKSLLLCLIGANALSDKHLHHLLVGDPGLNKTNILKRLSSFVKISQFVTVVSKTTTVAGLIGAVERNEQGMWMFTAGMISRCNGGLFLVDEIDKLNSGNGNDSTNAFLQLLEDGKIAVTKAGVNNTIKVDVDIVFSSNPKNISFNDIKPMIEQINLDEALVSRLAMIIPFRDVVDKDRDKKIVKTIMKKERKIQEINAAGRQDDKFYNHVCEEEYRFPDGRTITIDDDYIRKLIASAKKIHVEQIEELDEYVNFMFVKFRYTHNKFNFRTVPYMKAFLEANCRLHHKTRVTEEMVEEVINIYDYHYKLLSPDNDLSRFNSTISNEEIKLIIDIRRFVSGNEGCTLAHIQSNIEFGNLDVNNILSKMLNTQDLDFKGGKYYMHKDEES